MISSEYRNIIRWSHYDEQFAVKFTKTIHRNTKHGTSRRKILDLSKIESGEFHLDLQQYYLYPLVHNILKDLDDAIKKKIKDYS